MGVWQGKLLAGVHSKVQLFKFSSRGDGAHELTQECSHAGHIMALYVATRGDFILVGVLCSIVQRMCLLAADTCAHARSNVAWRHAHGHVLQWCMQHRECMLAHHSSAGY